VKTICLIQIAKGGKMAVACRSARTRKSSAEWIAYFQRQRETLLAIPWHRGSGLSDNECIVVGPSLRILQQGEALEGGHFFRCAREHAEASGDFEGRILHRDWSLYDTGHVVFQPRHMTVEQLADGYAWCYRRLFSHASIWRRRPADVRAVVPYLAMSYLYKRSNWLWHQLIKRRATARAWGGLVEWTRRRHLSFRKRLEERPEADVMAGCVVSAGV
jgi:hypothetical protein